MRRTRITYKQRFSKTCSRAHSNGTVLEHLVIAEEALGRPLPRRAQVHHVDGNPRNNDRRNLVICEDGAYHMLLHVRQRVIAAGGNPSTQRVCGRCREAKDLSEFASFKAHKAQGKGSYCKPCRAAKFREWSVSRRRAA